MGARWVRGASAALWMLAAACSGSVGSASTKQDVDVRPERVERINKKACKRVLACQPVLAADAAETDDEGRGFDGEESCLSEANKTVQMLVDLTDDNCTDAYLDFAECAAASDCSDKDPACSRYDLAIDKRCPKGVLDDIPLEGS